MKRILCLSLTFLIALSLISVGTVVNATPPTVLITENFEADGFNTWTNASRYTQVSDSTSTYGIGKYIKTTGTSGNANTDLGELGGIPQATGLKGYYEFDVMVSGLGNGAKVDTGICFAGNNSRAASITFEKDASGNKSIYFKVGKAVIDGLSSSSNNLVVANDYEDEVWYRVRFELFIPEKTMNIYFNGAKVNADISGEYTTADLPKWQTTSDSANISKAGLYCPTSGYGAIDNVLFIRQDVDNDEPVFKDKLIADIRAADTIYKAAPDSSEKTTFGAAITAAKGVYENAAATQATVNEAVSTLAAAKEAFSPTGPAQPTLSPIDDISNVTMLSTDLAREITITGAEYTNGTETLAITAESSDTGVATVNGTIDNVTRTLTVTPVGVGQTTITVRANAADVAERTKSFTVTVEDPAAPLTGKVYSEYFEGYAQISDVASAGWVSSNNGTAALPNSSDRGVGKAVSIEGSSSGRNYYYTLPTAKQIAVPGSEAVATTVYYEFDAMVTGVDNSANSATEFTLANNAGQQAAAKILFDKDRGILLQSSGVGGGPDLANYDSENKWLTLKNSFENNRWYRFRLELFVCDESGTGIKTMNVYIDGKKANAENTDKSTLPKWTSSSNTNISQIRMQVSGRSQTPYAKAYIDNILLYKQDGTTTEPPVDKGLLIGALREADRKLAAATDVGDGDGQYTQEAKNALTTAISTAAAVYDNTSATQSEVDTEANNIVNAVRSFRANGELPVEAVLNFENEAGAPVFALVGNDTIITKAEVFNFDGEEISALLIVAAYKQNGESFEMVQMGSLGSENASAIGAGNSETLSCTIDLSDFDDTEKASMMLKILLWNDLDGLSPLLPACDTGANLGSL